jgi:hypothetical protein
VVTMPDEFAKIVASDIGLWRDLVHDLGLEPQ